MNTKRAMLVILDGWGLGKIAASDAIAQANTPVFDRLWAQYPHSTLITYGEKVGLPEGQMGNSEVGHLNIGAGRIVYQELARINKAIETGVLAKNKKLQAAIEYAKNKGKAVHLMGLVSDGGVHSHIDHLLALIDIIEGYGHEKIYIHAFTDGRDTDPQGARQYLKTVLDHIENKNTRLASIIGRYYAMDRDKRWERIKLAYDLLVKGKGELTKEPLSLLEERYEAGQTDEFILPIIIEDQKGNIAPSIQSDDVLICFNFRTDRPRQISQVLTQEDRLDKGMKKFSLHYLTMTRYDQKFKNVEVLFEKENLKHTLGETLENAGKTQLRIAETEKYAHVTFFFNGGREAPFKGEDRILIPSPQEVATYDLKPEMSANEITAAAIATIEEKQPDFICLNYANTDMVGHTGVFSAAMKAAETVDNCLGQLIKTGLKQGYEAIIIADHGNSDYLVNEDGSPNTAHSMNPVPCIFVHQREVIYGMKDGKLSDVAPSLLWMLGLKSPKEMDGEILIYEK